MQINIKKSRVCLHVSEMEQCGLSPTQLTALRGESASVKTLQGTIRALEEDKANLQDHVKRLEKDLAAGPEAINRPSGNTGLKLCPQLILYQHSGQCINYSNRVLGVVYR